MPSDEVLTIISKIDDLITKVDLTVAATQETQKEVADLRREGAVTKQIFNEEKIDRGGASCEPSRSSSRPRAEQQFSGVLGHKHTVAALRVQNELQYFQHSFREEIKELENNLSSRLLKELVDVFGGIGLSETATRFEVVLAEMKAFAPKQPRLPNSSPPQRTPRLLRGGPKQKDLEDKRHREALEASRRESELEDNLALHDPLHGIEAKLNKILEESKELQAQGNLSIQSVNTAITEIKGQLQVDSQSDLKKIFEELKALQAEMNRSIPSMAAKINDSHSHQIDSQVDLKNNFAEIKELRAEIKKLQVDSQVDLNKVLEEIKVPIREGNLSIKSAITEIQGKPQVDSHMQIKKILQEFKDSQAIPTLAGQVKEIESAVQKLPRIIDKEVQSGIQELAKLLTQTAEPQQGTEPQQTPEIMTLLVEVKEQGVKELDSIAKNTQSLDSIEKANQSQNYAFLGIVVILSMIASLIVLFKAW